MGELHTIMALPGARGMDRLTFHAESGRARCELD